jgi:hypothetical protein
MWWMGRSSSMGAVVAGPRMGQNKGKTDQLQVRGEEM